MRKRTLEVITLPLWINRQSFIRVSFAMKMSFASFCRVGFAALGFYSNHTHAQPFMIESPAFADQGTLPIKYTCVGSSVSPPLQWSNTPRGTKSFVLILTDLDAPYGMNRTNTRKFYHWGIFNIPAKLQSLPENADDHLPEAISEAMNDAVNKNYNPPCPPEGTHRYVFSLYALDKTYKDEAIESAERLQQWLEDAHSPEYRHVLGKAKITTITSF